MNTHTSTQPRIPGFISDKNGKYTSRGRLSGEQIVKAAHAVLKRKFDRGQTLTSPDATRAYLMTKYADYQHEIFGCLFLDNQHQILSLEELFRGTIDGASVYPREVVKRALQLNSAALFLYITTLPVLQNQAWQIDVSQTN